MWPDFIAFDGLGCLRALVSVYAAPLEKATVLSPLPPHARAAARRFVVSAHQQGE